MNTFGDLFRVTTFGESHGPAVGAVVDGCPAGVPLTTEDVQRALDRRRPGQSALTTARAEADRVELLSGVYEDKTLGTPIAGVVRNTDQRSQDYDALKSVDRKGHADKTWRDKYGHRDHRGGGRTSARETVGRVIGGAIAEAYLRRDLPDLTTTAWVAQVGPLRAPHPPAGITRALVDAHPTRWPDPATADAAAALILQAKEAGDTLGGAVDVRVVGVPVGLGEPVFGKLKALLAHAVASLPAVAGTSWLGPDGVDALALRGSAFHARDDVYGGVQGGISSGAPIELRVWFKPPATMAEHAKGGRHDPCVLPRAVPVVEAMVSLVIADLVLAQRARPHRA